jgi:glycosyltransferase involved in cell wall biosynthesis
MEYKAQWGLFDRESEASINLKQSLALSVLRWLETMTYRSAQIIQTDSRYTLEVLHKDYPSMVANKGVAAPLWVDLDRFSFCQDKSIPRKRLGLERQSTSPIFFTVRRLMPRMGIDNLIRAVHLLAGDGIDCRLVIGGSGPEKDTLLKLIQQLQVENRVVMVGNISEEELPLFFQAADCFVLPTKALECFGLIILEAYACGTPVIGTPVGSIPEVMGDYYADFVTEDSGAKALYRKMKEFISGRLLVEPTRLRTYAESFSYETMAKNLYGVVTGKIATS